jgi:ABC-type uncharacterized transport system YnjBCD substrate-binding protein
MSQYVTVAGTAAALAIKCGQLVTAAGLDGTASSPVFLDAIATSARESGIALASPFTVTDADLVVIAANQQDVATQLLEVAWLRALETALSNYIDVDEKIGESSMAWDETRKSLDAQITRMLAIVKAKYGIGLGTGSLGSLDLGFSTPGLWCFPPGP